MMKSNSKIKKMYDFLDVNYILSWKGLKYTNISSPTTALFKVQRGTIANYRTRFIKKSWYLQSNSELGFLGSLCPNGLDKGIFGFFLSLLISWKKDFQYSSNRIMKHIAKSWGNFDREQRTSYLEILKIQGKPLLHVIQLNPWTLEFLIFVFARWIRILFPLQNMWKVGVNWGEEAVMQTGRSSKVTIGGRSAGLRDAINKSSFGRLA